MSRYFAYAEETPETGVINVITDWATKKKKTFLTLDCPSTYYVSLAFDPRDETRYLAALSGPPKWMIIYWDFSSKPKMLATIEVPGNFHLYSLSFHPKEESFMFVFGNATLKTFKYKSGTIELKNTISAKTMKDFASVSQNFLSHSWLNDGQLMVGNDRGDLLQVNGQNVSNYEFRRVLGRSPGEGFPIEVMIPYSKGFIVGGPDATVIIYDKHEGDINNPYIPVEKKIQVYFFELCISDSD